MIMGTLQVAYPKFYNNLLQEQRKLTVDLWTKMLSDVTAEEVTLAVNKIIATSEWPPTIAEVRKVISEIQKGSAKEAGEAWGEVSAAIRKFGYLREKEALESMSEETRKAVEFMNWQVICRSENLIADRAHFFKVYEAIRKRSVEENQIPFFIKDKIMRNIENNMLKIKCADISKEKKEEKTQTVIPEKISEILIKMSERRKERKSENE